MRRLIPVALLGVLGGLYGGYRLYLASRPFEWSGTVEARASTVSSRAGGRVRQVLAAEGERVAAGQPLVILEAADLEAQRLTAEGQLVQAQAALDKLEHGARPEEIAAARARADSATAALAQARTGPRREEIAAAEQRLAAAQAALDQAQLEDARARALFKSNALPRAQADAAAAALRAARAQRNALAQVVDELRAGARAEEVAQAAALAREARASAALVAAGARAEDIAAATGAVKAARGRLDQVNALLAELTIRAPVAAVVETLDLRPGDVLAPNAPAARLLEQDQLYVRIYVPETQLGFVRVGQKLPIGIDSFPDARIEGVVEWVSSVGEFSPRNLQTADERADEVFATRVRIVAGRERLRAGMAATVKVPRP